MLVNKLEKLYLVGKSVHSHPSLVFINAIQKHQSYRPFAQVTECIAKNNLSYYLQSHPHTKKKGLWGYLERPGYQQFFP